MCPAIQYAKEGILVESGVRSEKAVVGKRAAPMMKQTAVHMRMSCFSF